MISATVVVIDVTFLVPVLIRLSTTLIWQLAMIKIAFFKGRVLKSLL